MTPPTTSSFEAMYRELLLEFLAELLNATSTSETPDAFPCAVQTFCDELRPWLTPDDLPTEPRAVFSLFVDWTINMETEVSTVQLSPEGEAFFRAWVRRQAVLVETTAPTEPEPSH